MLKVDFSPLQKFSQNLEKFISNCTLDGIESTVKGIVVTSVQEQIASRGARSSEPWPKLANSDREPLNVSGELRRTATSPTVEVQDKLTILVSFSGNHGDLLAIHNEGAKIERNYKRIGQRTITIPKRRVVALIDQDYQKMNNAIKVKIITDFVNTLLGK